MLLKESRTQPGVNSSAQLESQAEISLSVGVACEGPAQGVCLLLPFDKVLKQYWGLTRLEFQIHSVPKFHCFVDRFNAAKR